MTDIIKSKSNLPSTIPLLNKFILIKEQQLESQKAEIKAIKSAGLGAEVEKQKIWEAEQTAEIVLDATTRLGELLAELPKPKFNKPINGSLRGTIESLPPGISKKRSHQAQTLAKNKAIVEQEKAKAKEKDDLPTPKKIYRIIKHQERKNKLKNEVIKAVSNKPPIVKLSDAIEWLNLQKEVDLLLTDPPYSTDVNDIYKFASSWLPLALTTLKPTGRAYVCIGAYPQELHAYLSVSMPSQILVWTYKNTLGPTPTNLYKQNWQAILYYQMPDAPKINCPIMLEQFSVQDINAPDGRLGDRYHAWQKPMELAERFIKHSTEPEQIVIDPFCCTGTFLLAAAKLGRISRGCDNNEDNLNIAIERGCVRE